MVKPALPRIVAQVYIQLDGKELVPEAGADLLAARIEGSVHLPDSAELRFRNPDMVWSEREQFKIGQELKVDFGDADLKRPVFIGEITSVELDVGMSGVVELQVRAYDRSHRLHRGRVTQVFRNMTDSDIAKQIARDLSFTPEVEATSEVHEYVLQDNQTSWDFLQERAGRLGFEIQVHDKSLIFKPPPSAPSEPIDLAWHAELLSFRARMTTLEQVNEVEVRGWDPLNKKPVMGRASTPKGLPKIGESRNGGQVSATAFQKASLLVARQPIYSQAQADRLAQSVLDELAGSFVTAEGVALGDPRLRLGTEVNLLSVGKQFTGKYIVTQIAHVYEPTGYRIEFEVTGRRATDLVALISPPQQTALHVLTGIVTNNKDDRDVGRVKVKLPVLGQDVESNWSRIVSAGAGKNRGIEYLPEVDDEVLLIGSDVNNLYVLGGLWSVTDSPAVKAAQAVSGGEVVKRVIRSRTGHQIILDDSPAGSSITIVDSTEKNKIVIDTVKKSLEMTVDGDISIKAGGSVSISAGTGMDLKASTSLAASSGTDMTLKATTSLAASAGTEATVEATRVALTGRAAVQVAAPAVSLG